jgi:hypothetical protein
MQKKTLVFTSGPLGRHVIAMLAPASMGLLAVFAGDLAHVFFLGQLNDTEVLAAIGGMRLGRGHPNKDAR